MTKKTSANLNTGEQNNFLNDAGEYANLSQLCSLVFRPRSS